MEKHHKLGQRIGLRGCKSEFVFRPLARNVLDLRLRVGCSAGLIRFKRHGYLAGETTRFQPEIAVIGNALPHRNSPLADAPSLTIVGGHVNAQGMFHPVSLQIPGHRIRNGIVPPEVQCGIVVAIVGLPFPIARQADRVGRFIEAAVADQFGI